MPFDYSNPPSGSESYNFELPKDKPVKPASTAKPVEGSEIQGRQVKLFVAISQDSTAGQINAIASDNIQPRAPQVSAEVNPIKTEVNEPSIQRHGLKDVKDRINILELRLANEANFPNKNEFNLAKGYIEAITDFIKEVEAGKEKLLEANGNDRLPALVKDVETAEILLDNIEKTDIEPPPYTTDTEPTQSFDTDNSDVDSLSISEASDTEPFSDLEEDIPPPAYQESSDPPPPYQESSTSQPPTSETIPPYIPGPETQ